jgi:hypothetical protein
MKRILIILGNYSPNPSSVAICTEPLIQKLIHRGYEVDIITNRKRIDLPAYECINRVNVYRIDDYRVMNTEHLADLVKINSNKILKFITRTVSFFLKACYYITYCINKVEKETSGWDLDSAVLKCIELNKLNEYNAVISYSLPFRAHHIAHQFIGKLIKPIPWFIYEYDPFSFNKEQKIGTRKRKKIFKDEFAMLQTCDRVFLTPELYKFYSKTPFNDIMDKFISIPYANMSPIKYSGCYSSEIRFNSDKINCLFIGRLYTDIRNPDYMVQLFSSISNDIHFSLITNFSKKLILGNHAGIEDKFTVLPFQTRDTALKALIDADILVNIGNSVEFQIPGKIFEYMSTGKPILHFSKFSEDPAITYLKRYPKALIINEWERNLKEQSFQVEKFCRENKGVRLSYDEVCTALSDLNSDFVAEKFVDIVDSLTHLLNKE